MQKIIEKAGILIEALPYIQAFKDKITLIKFGGSAMTDENCMRNVLKDIVFLYSVGIKPIVVHGGGNRISEAMKELGKTPRFVQGFRVTDEETINTVENVLYGEINPQIVQMIEELGGKAEGLSGRVHKIINASKHTLPAPDQDVDLGYVGDVKQIYAHPVISVLHSGKIPVIAPLAFGADGHTYNINADLAAGEIARALGAEKLVFLTDVPGIMKDASDKSSLISHLDISLVSSLIDKKVITGGMIPKVMAGIRSVTSGVHKTHIIDGRLPHTLLLEIFTDRGIGTEIVQINSGSED
ncbi:MAG: acetylglutamate kinase [Candidatus Auribacterota bacterium]|jgi:acetylglutamate kinase|uniref:Acetylglutamate kinase n=1 Tax=Candidatus Auribacter fodinae TaxID=2093366 RepID=A0A3A4R868_9BACT|nr:MAG: acetylglutamate kinase [Candidatus Auribacter fodinae]